MYLILGKDEKRKVMSNAMYKLEHDVGDAETAQQAAPSLEKLEVSLLQTCF